MPVCLSAQLCKQSASVPPFIPPFSRQETSQRVLGPTHSVLPQLRNLFCAVCTIRHCLPSHISASETVPSGAQNPNISVPPLESTKERWIWWLRKVVRSILAAGAVLGFGPPPLFQGSSPFRLLVQRPRPAGWPAKVPTAIWQLPRQARPALGSWIIETKVDGCMLLRK